MPYFRNNNRHGVRALGERIGRGSIGEVSDEAAKVFEGYNGVEKVSEKEGKAAVAERDPLGSRGEAKPPEAVVEAQKAKKQAVGAASVVRGDDEAPAGPDTGTVTTRQLAGKKDPEAFGEPLTKQKDADKQTAPQGVLTSGQVHNEQTEAEKEADKVARAINKERGGKKKDKKD